MQGQIARQRGDLARAARFYREALGLLEAAVIDAALVGTELVRVLLEAGQTHQAQISAAGLSSIADTVSEHPVDLDQAISAALLDLALAGLEARLSLTFVSQVVESIKRGRAAATARLRQNLRL